jgi:hypothetical protein
MQKKIYIHVPKLPNTIRSLKNILNRLQNAKLPDDVNIILCHSPQYATELQPHIKEYKLNLILHELSHGVEFFEYPTLHKIWEDAQKEDFYCLYMHAKGASKTQEIDILNAEAWTNYMLFAVVDNYPLCIEHLDKGAEVVGCQWHWHFKGNFWWANSKHLKHMPNPIGITGERFNAEYWCCLGYWWDGLKVPKPKNLFYLPDLKDDTNFLYLSSQVPLSDIKLDTKYAFIDKRIDPDQPQTLKEFLDQDYKCALDEIYILESDISILSYLKYFMNYDAQITLLRGDEEGSFYSLNYDDIT